MREREGKNLYRKVHLRFTTAVHNKAGYRIKMKERIRRGNRVWDIVVCARKGGQRLDDKIVIVVLWLFNSACFIFIKFEVGCRGRNNDYWEFAAATDLLASFYIHTTGSKWYKKKASKTSEHQFQIWILIYFLLHIEWHSYKTFISVYNLCSHSFFFKSYCYSTLYSSVYDTDLQNGKCRTNMEMALRLTALWE